MIISEMVTECDFTGRKYDEPVPGGACIARGATGRHCVVMHVGPEEIAERKFTLISRDEAYSRIENANDGGYADF